MYYIWIFNKIRRGKAKLKTLIYVKKIIILPLFCRKGELRVGR